MRTFSHLWQHRCYRLHRTFYKKRLRSICVERLLWSLTSEGCVSGLSSFCCRAAGFHPAALCRTHQLRLLRPLHSDCLINVMVTLIALGLNLKYCQIGAFKFRFVTKSSAIVLSVNSLSRHVWNLTPATLSWDSIQSRHFQFQIVASVIQLCVDNTALMQKWTKWILFL